MNKDKPGNSNKSQKKIYSHDCIKHNKEIDNKIITLLDEEKEVNSDGNKNSVTHMGCSNAC
ncbi:hypothetical protein JYG23_12050 [Sedimentibacter sp. zth1]|uniref:hypothetical protein n=1 Tax=Sedimentibacter sp. zth1 TaxID=2816908 RepID=UPI001A913132|nr:hypothetical protein [Sedimentibacter sp. zth1]QSX05400.1 hypothetical protein JYG23_12050 [Sedimentibacter sp. zth1]